MKQLRISAGIFLLSLFYLLLLGCKNSTDESTETKTVSDEMTTNESKDTSEVRDPYWVEQSVGGSTAEKKQQLVKKYNSLLVFHANDTMEVKQVYTATLALARNAELEPLKMRVLKESEATDDKVLVDSTIELGKRMKATLVDWSSAAEPSFSIKAMGSDEQNLSKTKEAIWQWRIEPLKAGPHKLKLSIQVILSDGDQINLPVRNIPIIIFAKKVSFATKVGNFFSNYWQWVITAILLPILIAWLTTRIRQSGEKKK